ncbi:MAG: FG-GAP repeat protein [Verrucomicrobiales bacterium]
MFPDDTGIRGDQQYFDIEISENERLIAAGIPDQHYGGNFESPGAVLFYEKIGGQWQGTARIGASDKSDFEDFGWSIALDGDTIAAGNPKEDVAGTANYDWFGAVYVFSADLSGAPEVEVDAYLRAQLYYEQALADACCSPGDAAFRWKTLLYEGTGSGLHAAPDKIGEYFGAAERQSAAAVRQQVADLLAGNPGSELFRDLLLDIDADLLASEAIAARANLVNIDRDRLLRVGVPPLDLILDDEIADYEAALPGMRAALAGYLDLWTDDLGAAGGGEPLGYTIFKERVPQRDLMPALYLDNGSLQPAGGSGSALQSGYRDATMLYERFADFGETAATLAHLYWLRNTPASLQAARDLIGETSRFLFVQGNTLRGTFPENPAQLQVPMASWNAALAALSKAEADLDGDLNPLGFEENFYVLFNVPQGGNSGLFDTFNILRERLDDTGSNANQIVRATDAQQEAIDAYEAYVGGQEEIEDRLSDLTRDAKLRLLAIVGAEYGTDAYHDSPGANVGEDGGFISGSELWQQFRNIRRAQIQIEKNGTEIQNLREAAAIEAERNLFETETQNAIGRIQIRYANQRADIQEQIGAWNAAQEYTNILKDAFNPANWGQVIGTAIAGGVAVGAELSKGELEAQRERIGGLEQAEIIGKENEILNANSAAKIKTMMLDMGVLVLNSQENAILLQQEIARLTALFRERAALERRIVQHEANLARRYFADPVHQPAT